MSDERSWESEEPHPAEDAGPSEGWEETADSDEHADEEYASPLDPLGDEGSSRSVNRWVPGVVVLHYPSRDVRVPLDGHSALRLLTMFSRRQSQRFADLLDPDESSATSAWLVLDVEEPLAMSWLPSSGQSARTAIDPPASLVG